MANRFAAKKISLKLAALPGSCAILALMLAAGGCANPAASQGLNSAGGPSAATASPALKAEKVKVTAQAVSWKDDPSPDGLRVWVQLLDASGKPVAYKNAAMSVKIALGPSPTEDLCEVGSVLYGDNAALTDSVKDSFSNGSPGIKDIAWDLIDQRQLGQPQSYGQMDVVVTLPDGKQIAGSVNEVPLKP